MKLTIDRLAYFLDFTQITNQEFVSNSILKVLQQMGNFLTVLRVGKRSPCKIIILLLFQSLRFRI
jgi:hypothetical protein